MNRPQPQSDGRFQFGLATLLLSISVVSVALAIYVWNPFIGAVAAALFSSVATIHIARHHWRCTLSQALTCGGIASMVFVASVLVAAVFIPLGHRLMSGRPLPQIHSSRDLLTFPIAALFIAIVIAIVACLAGSVLAVVAWGLYGILSWVRFFSYDILWHHWFKLRPPKPDPNDN